MNYKFNSKRKSFREGIKSVVYVLAMLFIGILQYITLDAGYTANMILIIVYTIIILFGIYRTIYNFKLHKEDYLIVDENSLSIYRGNIFPRKIISFDQIERVVQVNGAIILKLFNGKEEQIYTEWLSDKKTLELKNEFKQIFGSKAISF